jgi:hypothetical protein
MFWKFWILWILAGAATMFFFLVPDVFVRSNRDDSKN